MFGRFKLKVGSRFTVPYWAPRAAMPSEHAAEFPNTPMKLPLVRVAGRNCVPLSREDNHITPHLFLHVPEGIKRGEELEVVQVRRNGIARAVRVRGSQAV